MGTRKNSARDLLDTGTSSITINCHKDKNKYRITQFSKGRSIRYRISKNGVDLKIERIADAPEIYSQPGTYRRTIVHHSLPVTA